MRRVSLALCLMPLLVAVAYAQDAGWQPPETLLLSRPEKRERALRQLGLSEGEWVLALMSVRCGECDQVARQMGKRPRTVFVVDAPPQVARQWAKRLGVTARLVSGDEKLWAQLGGFYLPTLMRVQNGKVTGVRSTAP